jgi:RND family efflux transporter MFP subunit
MKTKWIILMIAVLSVTACNEDKKAKLEKMQADYEKLGSDIKALEAEMKKEGVGIDSTKGMQVPYIDLRKATFSHYIEVQGRIDGEENVVATSQVPGMVLNVYAKEGDNVKKGQVLADLDASVYNQTLKELNSSLEFITDLYEKQKALWDQKIGSEVQYLSAKNNKESLENRIKTMKEQIEMYKITAPINGTVEDSPLKVGQTMAPGLVAFRIINFSKVKVICDVSESYATRIKKGNDVKVSFPDDNKEFESKIDFTSKFINPVNRTFSIETYLKPGDIEYRANMIAVLNILDYQNKEAIVIPVNLIQKDSKEQYVWVAEKSGNHYVAKKKAVKQGDSYNGLCEILSGLNEGDRVLTTNLFDLLENQTVEL